METGNNGTPVEAGPNDTTPNLELSLSSVPHVPVQEQSEHLTSPFSLRNLTNTRLVPGHTIHSSRPIHGGASNCCEDVRAELKADFEIFRTEMDRRVSDLTVKIDQKDNELERVKLERDGAHQSLELKEREVLVSDREKLADKHEAERQIRERDEEIKKLRQQNEDLQNKVDLLTEEKQRLEECVNSLNHKVDTLNQSIQNMQNHNDSIKQDMEQMRAALAANGNHQCNHQEEIRSAIKISEQRMMERLTMMISTMDTGSVSSFFFGEKLGNFKSGSSKSNSPSPSISPAASEHSSKPPSPPPPVSDNDDQHVPDS